MADSHATTEDTLELKKRARRRLVGAVALALFAVIMLPMVMDREPKPATQDIQIRIPSQETELLASRLPEKLQAEPALIAKEPAPAPLTGPSEPSVSGAVKPATRSPSKFDAATIMEAAKVDSPKAATVKPDTGKGVSDAAKTSDMTAPKKAEEVRATAALEGKDSGGPWIVQLGAYQNAGNVKLLLAKVKEMGIPVYSEKLESAQGPRTRVRAGPFNTREAADKAQSRIRKIGVDGSVAQKQ